MQKENITVLDHHFALELITQDNRCIGAYALDEKTNDVITYQSDFTLLATGGIGHLYGHTTNPIIATGDGIAMAYRANAVIQDMEFIQFHPTALFDTTSGSKFLISEAVRGFGARLRTKKGELFMLNYDSRGDLASRDIVSQSIDLELKKSGDECVYLDCTHLDMVGFKNHFPMIYKHCQKMGIDIEKEWIPVVPAQHYLCGGIVVDINGKTSVENLFACGECSRTGLHGANRLASNSLLEALVYSDKIYHYLAENPFIAPKSSNTIPKWFIESKVKIDPKYVAQTKAKLQLLMRQNAGIVRFDSDLLKANEALKSLQNEIDEKIQSHIVSTDLYELNNMIDIGKLIVQQSIDRNGNCGGFVKYESNDIK
jgi:L-aspartate oxidase